MIDAVRYYRRVVGVRGLVSAIKGKITKTRRLLQIKRPEIAFPFFLRVPSSDVLAFEQIFINHAYDFEINRPPKTIIDAGANIGLASIYFSNKFPGSKIIALEPEESNFALLKQNVALYGNIIPVCGALWHEDGRIDLVDPGLGEWGFMTQAQDDVKQGYGEILHEARGMTVDTIMKKQGIEHIDILKIDIEGAEQEVFGNPSSWIGKVDALIIELHDRMKPGCSRSFYEGSKGFDNRWLRGENVYLTRRGACLTRHHA